MDEAILASAMYILGRRNHSRYELLVKLKRKYPEMVAEINQVLDRLEKTGVINDITFAHEYVHYIQSSNPKGKLRLQQELQKKGIAPELINTTLADDVLKEEVLAMQLAERKLALLPVDLEPIKKQEKIYRFLVSRGFAFAIARDTTKQAIHKNSE